MEQRAHSLHLEGNKLEIEGVIEVISACEKEAIIALTERRLVIEGTGIRCDNVDLSSGRVRLTGDIKSVAYRVGGVGKKRAEKAVQMTLAQEALAALLFAVWGLVVGTALFGSAMARQAWLRAVLTCATLLLGAGGFATLSLWTTGGVLRGFAVLLCGGAALLALLAWLKIARDWAVYERRFVDKKSEKTS